MSELNPAAYFEIHNSLADSLLKGSHQLAGVPEADRPAVLRAALDAVPEAAALLRPFPVLYADGENSASRLAFSCLSAAATFPGARRDQIADLGALTAVLFGLDDVADGISGQWSDRDFTLFVERLRAAVSSTPSEHDPELVPGAVPGDGPPDSSKDAPEDGPKGGPEDGTEGPMGEVLGAWRAWCARFHRHPAASVHAPNLDRRLALAGAAMARERAWAAGTDPWPPYDDYVANGLLTILYPTWWAAALAVCGPAPADAAHWAVIEPATHLGAACMRLANDIRTFEREKAEGKPNSISILESTGLSTAQAVERVSAHIDDLDAGFRAAVAALPAGLEGIADGQRRSVSFNGRWYMARDTHAYTVRDLAGDADAHDSHPT